MLIKESGEISYRTRELENTYLKNLLNSEFETKFVKQISDLEDMYETTIIKQDKKGYEIHEEFVLNPVFPHGEKNLFKSFKILKYKFLKIFH